MSAGEWPAQARAMIGRAVQAPSGHNTQPWRFRLTGSGIELRADRARALRVNDPDDRELVISCGCALMNLRAAAAAAGWGVETELFPRSGEPDLLARLSRGDPASAAPEEAALAEFIEHRRTCRRTFAAREVDPTAIDRLIAAAESEDAWLRPLTTGEARGRAAELIAEGDAAQWCDPDWRRELAAWMRPRRRGDGLAMPALAVPLARWVVRSFDLGGRLAANDRGLAQDSPLLAVLGTEQDGPRQRLVAGQALQRMLLVACGHGLQASYLNQPVQVASLRPQLAELVGGGFPQILLRIGHPAGKVTAAPRRPLDEVMDR